MSQQFEHETQQSQAPEEIRQPLLAELDASKQAIEELSDDELEAVNGGLSLSRGLSKAKAFYENKLQIHPENLVSKLKAQFQPDETPGGMYINGKYRPPKSHFV